MALSSPTVRYASPLSAPAAFACDCAELLAVAVAATAAAATMNERLLR